MVCTIVIVTEKEGYKRDILLSPIKFNQWYWGNIVFLLPIFSFVDILSGASSYYSNPIHIDLKKETNIGVNK